MRPDTHICLTRTFDNLESILSDVRRLAVLDWFATEEDGVQFIRALNRAQAKLDEARDYLARPVNPLLIPTAEDGLQQMQRQAVLEAHAIARDGKQ